jgi:hypothetical protein
MGQAEITKVLFYYTNLLVWAKHAIETGQVSPQASAAFGDMKSYEEVREELRQAVYGAS